MSKYYFNKLEDLVEGRINWAVEPPVSVALTLASLAETVTRAIDELHDRLDTLERGE